MRSAAALLVHDGRADGRDFDHLETELALGHFLQSDIHESQAGIDDDERAETLPELANALGNDVDQNLRAVNDLKSVLNESLFHRMMAAVNRNDFSLKRKGLSMPYDWHKSSLSRIFLAPCFSAQKLLKNCPAIAYLLRLGNQHDFTSHSM
jgi:hypothetical protein